MKIGLLGGAYNPPHKGHQIVAQQVLDFTDLGEVWFLPNNDQRYYGGQQYKLVAPVAHRLAMTKLLEFPGTKISTLEIDHKLDGQTIKILPLLPKEHTFSFIIGSDQLPTFHLWDGWQELLHAMTFLVFPRHGYNCEPLYENMRVISHELLVETNISSTKVRERVKRGLPIDQFVPPAVAAYIVDHGLYRSPYVPL